MISSKGPPAKPVITSVLIKPNGKTQLKWQAEHLGGAKHLRNIFIEYSANFSDPSQQLNNIGNFRSLLHYFAFFFS